jgi:dTDP-4-amino-4,6-dideoxygalactose transaminase
VTDSSRPLYVAQPSMPPLEEFTVHLETIWRNRILTNGGPYHEQLERALVEHLGVPHVSLFSNGTIALMVALQALEISGEVITTPYSFIATAHSLLWNQLEPVFVDIDPQTLNLDPAKVEQAITERTSAILPVHCYGQSCDAQGLESIASKHGLRVIYDAAHAFGVRDAGGSILRHGDLSVLSFHATKVFNTFEGGAIVCRDHQTKSRIDRLKNFGIVDEVTVEEVGLNGKMSEINAAFGLVQLSYVDQAIARRQQIDALYRSLLRGPGIRCLEFAKLQRANYSYFPILVEPAYKLSREALYQALRQRNIYSRRYFYPLISDFPMYRSLRSAAPDNLPVAASAAARVLCLPIYQQMTDEDVVRVASAVTELGA